MVDTATVHRTGAPLPLNTVFNARTAGQLRSDLELHSIISSAVSRFSSLSPEQLQRCAERAVYTSRDAARAMCFHSRTPEFIRAGGGIAVYGTARSSANDSNLLRRGIHQDGFNCGVAVSRSRSRLPIRSDGTLAEEPPFTINGAGPGAMESSSHGAGGRCFGAAIRLPKEEKPNPYIPKENLISFNRFPFRKMFLTGDVVRAVLVCGGGYGTVEEFSEVLSLTEAGTILSKPVAFISKPFWSEVIEMFREREIVKPETLKKICVVDDPEEAMAFIRKFYEERPESREFQPFQILENHTDKGVMPSGVVTSEKRALVASLSANVANLFSQNFEEANFSDRCDDKVMYGTLKFFADRFMMECGLESIGIKEFVLQLGSPNHPSFNEVSNEILSRGIPVASKIPDDILRELGSRAGLRLQVPVNSEIREYFIPSKYRLTAIDVATDDDHLRGVIASEGKISTYHRTKELECWRQTGKLLPRTAIVAYAPNENCLIPALASHLNPLLLKYGFISGGDNKIMQVGETVKDAVDQLNL